MTSERITPAEVRESKHKPVAWSADDLANQMEADAMEALYFMTEYQYNVQQHEERLKGRVLAMTQITSWDTLEAKRYYAAIDSDVCALNGNTPEEAIANLQRAIDEEAERRE